MVVKRSEIIQPLIDLFEEPSYLEIGVAEGQTFHAIRAASKVAVDPGFRFDVEAARAEHPEATYHVETSDAYFARHAGDRCFDLINIDGLHTLEQTLRDLMNALAHVHSRSIIVIDDVYPNSAAAALPDVRAARRMRQEMGIKGNAWMGDIYKLVMFIDTFMPAWDFRCTSDNHGQAVMWQAKRETVTPRTFAGIAAADYDQAVRERASFRFAPIAEIVEIVRTAQAKS